MRLLILILVMLTYYKGFMFLNFFHDYFLMGSQRNKYIEQELAIIAFNQKANKNLENEKNKITKDCNTKLMNYDSQMGNKILKLRLENVYKKYKMININNNHLIESCKQYLLETCQQDYNKCVKTMLSFLFTNDSK